MMSKEERLILKVKKEDKRLEIITVRAQRHFSSSAIICKLELWSKVVRDYKMMISKEERLYLKIKKEDERLICITVPAQRHCSSPASLFQPSVNANAPNSPPPNS